jgi:hypothetical protein
MKVESHQEYSQIAAVVLIKPLLNGINSNYIMIFNQIKLVGGNRNEIRTCWS